MTGEPFQPKRVELELPSATTTAALVCDYLRRVVHRGELGPGDRLPAERQLAETLGVGRVTLRESLQVLESEGYIVRRRGTTGGAFVTDLIEPFATWRAKVAQDRGALEELFDLREGVETQIVRLVAERRTARDTKAIRTAAESLRDTQTRADFRRADLQFHGLLATTARSPRLAALMYSVRGELFSPVEPNVIAARVAKAADGHASVVGAIAAGDADTAESEMRSHLRTARGELLKALRLR